MLDPDLRLNACSIPIYPLQRVFYPQNLACTPKNDEMSYMPLYIKGTKIRNKTKCTPPPPVSKCSENSDASSTQPISSPVFSSNSGFVKPSLDQVLG